VADGVEAGFRVHDTAAGEDEVKGLGEGPTAEDAEDAEDSERAHQE